MSLECFIKSVLRDVSTGAIETRISELWNQEAKSTKTVGRHNTETREMKLMERKHQKFQNFLKRKNFREANHGQLQSQ